MYYFDHLNLSTLYSLLCRHIIIKLLIILLLELSFNLLNIYVNANYRIMYFYISGYNSYLPNFQTESDN